KGKIYYCLDSAGMGSELGAYDTLTGSAGIVASFTPGPTNSTPRQFLVYGDKMYFVATDSTKGDELWSFDGTTFRCVTDIMPGGADGATFTIGMGTMAAFRGSIYLSARTSPNHHALFRYDTASGL